MSDKSANCLHTGYTTLNGYQAIINDLDNDYFGLKLRKLRKERKLSQSDIAIALGVSQGAVSYWEKGEKLPDLNTFWLLCQFLDVEPGYLMGSYKDITATTGLNDDSIRVLTAWQCNKPPLWLVSEDFEANVNEKPPCSRANVLNELCFKYPDIFGKILDKLSAFMLTEKDIDISTNKRKLSQNERIIYFKKAGYWYENKEENCSMYRYYDDNERSHITLDIDTFKQITQLEIMELLKDLKDAATKENNKK